MKRHSQHDYLPCRPAIISRFLAVLLGAVAAVNAHANADIFELPLESLMEMRVSVASPFGESVMGSASSVSVLRPTDWQERGARNLEEALESVPSVVSYASLGGASMFAIRGYANELSSRGTAMQLDGVPLNSYSYSTAAYSLPFISLSLLERAEVIRGAGSTLYGADAFHGVIALNTWQPAKNHREISITSGSPNQGQSSLVYGASNGQLRASAGFSHTHSDEAGSVYNYTDPVTGAPGRGTRDDIEENASGFLRLETGDAVDGLWRFGFFADAYESEDFPGTGSQFFRGLPSMVQVQSIDMLKDHDQMGQVSDFLLAQLQYQREISQQFTLDVRAFQWQNDQTWVLNSTAYPEDNEVSNLAGTPLLCRRNQNDSNATTSPLYCPHTQYQGTSERRSGLHFLLRHDGTLNTQWAVGAGRDWFDILDAPVSRIGVDGTFYYNAPTPFEGAARRIDHLLLQARTDSNAWSFVYGARWDKYSDINDAATSPRLAVIYRQPESPWSTKLIYGHAFRAPSAGEKYGSGGGTQQLPGVNLQPETIDTVELVWQMQRENAESELVVFGSRWLDGIVLVPVVGSVGVNQYINSGENSAHGVELVHHRTLGRWHAAGNISWVFSRNERSGFEYTGYPAYIGNFSIGRDLGNNWDISLSERIMLDMAEGDTIGAFVPPKANDYFRTDAHLGWQRDDVQIALSARNIFDRYNVVPSMFNASGGTPEPGVSLVASIKIAL